MAGAPGLIRARERIERAGRSELTSTPLRREALTALRSVVAFDFHVWVLTDPVTTVGVAPLADIPASAFAELPALIRSRYATADRRWARLLDRTSPVEVLDTVDVASGSDPGWPGRLSSHGVASVASVVHADAFGCWGFLDLWRSDGSPAFTPSDAVAIDSLTPAMTTALRRCQARTFAEPPSSARHEVGPVVLTLDDDLRVLTRTSPSQQWLDRLLPPGPGAAAIPASVLNVAAQLLAVEAGVDTHPARARTPLADGVWLTVRAARLRATRDPVVDDASAPGRIVVTIDESSAPERLDLFCRAFALSARETELVSLLASGSDTRAMARRMGVSELTIQDHLKSVFAKTGSHDRLTLVSRAVGTRGAAPDARG